MSEKTPLQWSQLQQPFSTLNKFNVVIITSIFFVIRSSQIFIQQFHPSVLDIKQHKKPKTTVPISYNEARDRRSKSLLRDRIVESFVAPFNTSDYRFP
jgi:hypothetical protein